MVRLGIDLKSRLDKVNNFTMDTACVKDPSATQKLSKLKNIK